LEDISAGQVMVPILLYHNIKDLLTPNRYTVSPGVFRTQMEKLKDWGYTTITASHLATVIVHGGELPSRPIVITFDDGYVSVYENAFPIMQEMGFVGTLYVISSKLESSKMVSVDQIREMADAGWEIGSHSTTHTSLKYAGYSLAWSEIYQSKVDLETELGVTVRTFAYPYGEMNNYIRSQTQEFGYIAGMGLGISNRHSLRDLYYLNRREVESKYDMGEFGALLPWSSPP
jgi:peptidoglycan/xylan/chitin deacetylase (PgdA/CDA1 family)